MRFQVTAECCQYMLPENHRAKRRLPDIVIVVDHAVALSTGLKPRLDTLGKPDWIALLIPAREGSHARFLISRSASAGSAEHSPILATHLPDG